MMSAYARYRETQVAEATPTELLLGMLDSMLQRLARARQAIVDRRPAEKGVALSPVFDALGELRAALDHTRAPELCARLDSLYAYYIERLRQASFTMKTAPIDEVIRHLRDMRATWGEAVAIQKRGQK